MSTTPWLIADDKDTDLIKYTGPWFTSQAFSAEHPEWYGKPFRDTLHGTKSNASFSFTFNGTQVAFFAKQTPHEVSFTMQVYMECVVLVSNIRSTTEPLPAGSNQQFCNSLPTLADGQHTVLVNVVIPGSNPLDQILWIDYLRYKPSLESSVNNAWFVVFSPDPGMQYGSGWIAAEPPLSQPMFSFIGNKTSTPGSTFTIQFNGESLLWFGYQDQSRGFAASRASYTIDDGAPAFFDINATMIIPDVPLVSEVILFQTPTFDNGPHTLTVTYEGDGDENSHPLTLQYVAVHNSHSTLIIPAVRSVASSSPIGPIVGGVLGALTLVIAVAVCFFFLRRRRNRLSKINDTYSIDESLHEPPTVDPFVITSEDIVNDKLVHSPDGPLETETGLTQTLAANNLHDSEKSGMRRRPPNPSPDYDYAQTSTFQPNTTPAPRVSFLHSQSEPTSVDVQLASSDSRIIFRRDEDSGIRLSRTGGTEVVLLPPQYTPS